MISSPPETEYIKLEHNISAKPGNNENLPSNDQTDTKSIGSKSVKLYDFDPKLSPPKPKFDNSNSKTKPLDTLGPKETNEEKEEHDDSTKLSFFNACNEAEQTLVSLSHDTENDFGEVECGEPTVTRKLTVDFTISQDDTDFVQQKCCDFWNFIKSNPELEHLMAIPEPVEQDVAQLEQLLEESASSVSSSTTTPPATATAIDVLQKNEKTVPQSFTTKQPPICRDQDYKTYCHGSCTRLEKAMRKKMKQEEAAKERSKKQLPIMDAPHISSPSFLRSLCSELEAWDLQHPKFFGPPAPVPCICTAEREPKRRLSLLIPEEAVCTSDMMCVPCSPSTEAALKLEKVDLEVGAEE